MMEAKLTQALRASMRRKAPDSVKAHEALSVMREMRYAKPAPGVPVLPYLWASDYVVDALRRAFPDCPWPYCEGGDD